MKMVFKDFADIQLEPNAGELDFCEWLKQEWSYGNQGMDLDLNNMSAKDALKLLTTIRNEWKKDLES